MIPRWALAGGASLVAHLALLTAAPAELRPGEPARLLTPNCRIRYPDQPPTVVPLDQTYRPATPRPRRLEIRQRRTIHLPPEPWPQAGPSPAVLADVPPAAPAWPEPDWEQAELLAGLGPAGSGLTAVGTTHGRLWLARARSTDELTAAIASRTGLRTGPLLVLLAYDWEPGTAWQPLPASGLDFPPFEGGTEGGLAGASFGDTGLRETSPLIPSFEQEGRPELSATVVAGLRGWVRLAPDGAIVVLPREVTAAFEARLPEALDGWNKLVALPRLWAAGNSGATVSGN